MHNTATLRQLDGSLMPDPNCVAKLSSSDFPLLLNTRSRWLICFLFCLSLLYKFQRINLSMKLHNIVSFLKQSMCVFSCLTHDSWSCRSESFPLHRLLKVLFTRLQKTDRVPRASVRKTPRGYKSKHGNNTSFWNSDEERGLGERSDRLPPGVSSVLLVPPTPNLDCRCKSCKKNVPGEHLHLNKWGEKRSFWKRCLLHDCSVRWHVPCVPALLTA